MAIALLTPNVTPYRAPLFDLLAQRLGVEVLCTGGGERYVPPWFAGLDYGARRLSGLRAAFAVGAEYEAVIAGFAGGAVLPAAFFGARRAQRPFVLWASVWTQPRSLAHTATRPITRHIYRRADAVLAYGEHVRRFVAGVRGRDDDVFVAAQAVEPELFAREVAEQDVRAFRERHGLGDGPLVLYAGRLVAAKGIEVLLDAWEAVASDATLVLIGDGPLADRARAAHGRVRVIAPIPREQLPVAYAASAFTVLASVPTPRFTEPWGLVCNEAMHQERAVIASDAVGAAAGGLVRDGVTGLVVPAGDARALASAIQRLLLDQALAARLGAAGREAVSAFNYEAAAAAFERALASAIGAAPARRS